MPMSYSATQKELETPFASSASVLRALTEGILLVDERDVIRQANPAAAQLLGLDAEQLLGMTAAQLPGGAASGAIEVDQRVLSFQSAPLYADDDSERVIGSLITVQELTERRALEQTQYDFVSRALHDVRVPLQAIGGTTEGLLRGWFGPINDEQREFLSTIKENANRQGALFSNIFDIYTLSANLLPLDCEPLHIEGLIHEVAQELAATYAARTNTLALDLPEELPAVLGDRRRLRQVLVALLENACKYTLPGGQVQLRIIPQPEQLHLEVQDTGVGIRAADQPQIFTPFFRGESVLKEGRYGGLNLAIARMLVELHHGELWFVSEEGQGSTFSLSLPIVQPAD